MLKTVQSIREWSTLVYQSSRFKRNVKCMERLIELLSILYGLSGAVTEMYFIQPTRLYLSLLIHLEWIPLLLL
jgi:hypothetical protein